MIAAPLFTRDQRGEVIMPRGVAGVEVRIRFVYYLLNDTRATLFYACLPNNVVFCVLCLTKKEYNSQDCFRGHKQTLNAAGSGKICKTAWRNVVFARVFMVLRKGFAMQHDSQSVASRSTGRKGAFSRGGRLLSVICSVCLALSLCPAVAWAASDSDTLTFDISEGPITIAKDGRGVKVSYGNGLEKGGIANTAKITIIGSSASNGITIKSDVTTNNCAPITLNGVSITGGTPFMVEANAMATLDLVGDNVLTATTDDQAGLMVGVSALLKVRGAGTLTATGAENGAGIGVGESGSTSRGLKFAASNAGSPTIIAQGGAGGAGIGGGAGSPGGRIEMGNNTILTAQGGAGGAGIGGGVGAAGTYAGSSNISNVQLTQGTVKATGGEGAAGIGGGRDGAGTGTGALIDVGNVTLTATAGVGAASIGGGENGAAGYIRISGGLIKADIIGTTSTDPADKGTFETAQINHGSGGSISITGTSVIYAQTISDQTGKTAPDYPERWKATVYEGDIGQVYGDKCDFTGVRPPVLAGKTLTIPEGLIVDANASGSWEVQSGGKLINNGIINLLGASDAATQGARLRCLEGATIDNGATGIITVGTHTHDDGVFENAGTGTNTGTLCVQGKFENSGDFTNSASGKVLVSPYIQDTTFARMGMFVNTGTFTNAAGSTLDVTQEESAGIVYAGLIDNRSTFINKGTFTNTTGKTAPVSPDPGDPSSQVGFINSGTYTNAEGAAINNKGVFANKANGTIANDGTITNAGPFTNEANGTITNNGAIDATAQALTNQGLIENLGTITGEVKNEGAGVVVQPSTTQVTFTKNGTAVTEAAYGDTVTFTATAQKSAATTRSAAKDTVEFWLGEVGTGTSLGTAPVTYDATSNTAVATLDVALMEPNWFIKDAYKITADFGGAGGLMKSTGTAQLKVTPNLVGDNATWIKGSGKNLAFGSAAPFDSFQSVSIEGVKLDPSQYKAASANADAKSGVVSKDASDSGASTLSAAEGTVIEVDAAYLETLAVGKHAISLEFTGGTAQGSFSIEQPKPLPPVDPGDKPANKPSAKILASTGDALPLAPLILSVLGLLSLAVIVLSRSRSKDA